MRNGTNPLLDTQLPPAPSIIAAVITHLPNRKGYHAERFDVIERCFQSIRHTCDLPIYVWDNGSDESFKRWLLAQRPDFVTFSRNIGKASARTAILRSFAPSTIICMSDDDILFEPGWLPAHLDLLEGFPNVGIVSGCPIRTQFRWGTKSTLDWARENATLYSGRFISDEWDRDFCISIGRDYERHKETSADDIDYLIEYKGLKAYGTAHHMQFVGYAGRLGQIGIWSQNAMRLEKTFDTAIDNLGMLRLTTTERYTRHLGNLPEAV